MLTRCEDSDTAEQALRNLHFLIGLELQKAGAEAVARDGTVKTRDMLQRMMDLEEALRMRLILTGTRHAVIRDAS